MKLGYRWRERSLRTKCIFTKPKHNSIQIEVTQAEFNETVVIKRNTCVKNADLGDWRALKELFLVGNTLLEEEYEM
jgi:hypothetical protein